jgi:hypothetical protein
MNKKKKIAEGLFIGKVKKPKSERNTKENVANQH